MALRLGEIADGATSEAAREQAREGQRDAEMFAEGAEKAARRLGTSTHDAIERLRNRR